jgi:integrase
MGLKPYQNFLDRLDSKEPQTKEAYVKYFRYYLQFLKVKDPNSLITKRFYSPRELQNIEDRIVSYINQLKKEGLKQSTIKGRKSAIEFFYRANRITLDWKHISGYIPSAGKTIEDEAYTTEDIEKMIQATTNPERDNFLLYLLSSTGMRIGALPNLKVGDIELMYPPGYQEKHIYKVIVYRGTRSEYYTFTTFECTEALDKYIKYRKRHGEVITKDSPLLRDQFNSNYRNKKKNEPNVIKSFSDVVDRITTRSGIRTRGHDRQARHNKMLDHAFRKFTNSAMIEAGVEYDSKEFLLGHKTTRGLDISYSRIPIANRLREYLKAMDLLTISPENRLRKQVAEQDYTIKVQLEQQRKQNEEQEKQIERLRKDMRIVLHANMRKSKALQDIELGERLNTARKKLVR